VVVGAGSGAVSLVIPVVGWTIGLAFVVGSLVSHRMLASVAGFLLGAGAMWAGLLLQADMRCRAFNAPGRECIRPDVTSWLAAGLAMIVVGALLTVVAARR